MYALSKGFKETAHFPRKKNQSRWPHSGSLDTLTIEAGNAHSLANESRPEIGFHNLVGVKALGETMAVCSNGVHVGSKNLRWGKKYGGSRLIKEVKKTTKEMESGTKKIELQTK